MKITFVSPGYENLAVEYLSSYLKKYGYKTSLVYDPLLFSDCYFNIPKLNNIFNFTPRVIKEISYQKPDLVAITAITPFYRWALNISENIKKIIDVPIILGGIHASAVPERVLKNKSIDMICIGEGEEPLLDVVKTIEKSDYEKLKTIKNIWYQDNNKKIYKNPPRCLIENLDGLPFPDKNLFYEKSKAFSNRYLAITSRGCIFNCTYCSNNVWRNVYDGTSMWNVRKRTVDNVINELLEAVDRWHPKVVSFVDDAFDMDKKWLEEFAIKYGKEIGLPFTSFAHPKFVDKKLTDLLKKAGLLGFELGVQSLNEDIKKGILHRYETNNEAITAIKNIKAAGAEVHVDHIIGLPGETEEDLKKASLTYNELKPTRINCFGLEYFPKSKIIETALEYGLIKKEYIEYIEEGYQTGFLLGGDTQNTRIFNNFRILFALLPHISHKKGEKLIKSMDDVNFSLPNLYKFNSFMYDLLRETDLMVKNFLKYYIEYMFKFVIGKKQ